MPRFELDNYTFERSGDGFRYTLPARKFKKAAWLGVPLMLFALPVIVFMVFWMSTPLQEGIEHLRKEQDGIGWVMLGFGGLGLIGLLFAIRLLIAGYNVATNRSYTIIEYENNQWRVLEKRFIPRLNRVRQRSDPHPSSQATNPLPLVRVRVTEAKLNNGERSQFEVQSWLGECSWTLVAEDAQADRDADVSSPDLFVAPGHGSFRIAVAYPRELLDRLAQDIGSRLGLEVVTSGARQSQFDLTETNSHVVRTGDVSDATSPQVTQSIKPILPPESTLVTLERRDNGITFVIPPLGVVRGSRGILFFAVFWNVFVGFFVVMMILGQLGIVEVTNDGSPWAFGFAMLPFVSVGIGLLLAVINLGRRHATITTAGEMLDIQQNSIFGTKVTELSSQQVREITVRNSGTRVNNQPVKELQIIPLEERKLGMLSQLPPDELRWIAAELTRSLCIDPKTADENAAARLPHDSDGRCLPASGSHLNVAHGNTETLIGIPARRVPGHLSGVVIGMIFVVIAIGVGWLFFSKNDDGDAIGVVFVSIWILLFGGGGVAIGLTSFVMSRRSFQIRVTPREVKVNRRGPFSSKEFSWDRQAIRSVELGNSSLEINGQKLQQIIIASTNGRPLRFMTGHPITDQLCVAAIINHGTADHA